MIDVMENIKKLSAALDAETASLHPSGKLLLLGSQAVGNFWWYREQQRLQSS